ncbi:MAG: 2-C-methyl-D-erythritol 4-phosphate cytidylyltransferase [Chloroflexi bacterium]|nr:2-C-methyl-D-erythritol 4-phosphate cytidylyltransferase [Chloroflexota bacterium]
MRALAILAAGASTRLGEDKVLADVGGRSVLAWSLAAAEASRTFEEMVVVAAPAALSRIADALAREGSDARVIAGGATRTASSWAALDALPNATVIAIHDAARPFVPPSLFERCVEAAERDGAAAAGLRLAETVRRVDESGGSLEEVEREGLWTAQTPQAFLRELLVRAREAARDRSFTDDAAAVTALGVGVRMIPGDRRNLKITTLEDLAYARELADKGLAAIATRAIR